MKISVDQLTATPTPFHYEEGSAWWRTRMLPQAGLPDGVAEPLQIDVRAHKMGADLYLDGQLEGGLELECGRCLARYRHRFREAFRLVLEPAGSRTPADPQAAEALLRDGLCLGDDFETGWYRGGEIHLDSVCLEVISLALPVKPLCQEDCAGLCAHCGANLAQGPCGCEQTAKDSPFAVLAALRDDHKGS